jgi:hypothetical protein
VVEKYEELVWLKIDWTLPSVRTWSQLWEINYVKISGVWNIQSMCLCVDIAFVFPFPFVLSNVLFLVLSLHVLFSVSVNYRVWGLSHSQREETVF